MAVAGTTTVGIVIQLSSMRTRIYPVGEHVQWNGGLDIMNNNTFIGRLINHDSTVLYGSALYILLHL